MHFTAAKDWTRKSSQRLIWHNFLNNNKKQSKDITYDDCSICLILVFHNHKGHKWVYLCIHLLSTSDACIYEQCFPVWYSSEDLAFAQIRGWNNPRRRKRLLTTTMWSKVWMVAFIICPSNSNIFSILMLWNTGFL